VRLSSTASRGRGRPREFDIDAALDKSVRIFRERGYHATSIGDLTKAMELASGSVYKAFKDKRAVFLAAFDREGKRRREQLGCFSRSNKMTTDQKIGVPRHTHTREDEGYYVLSGELEVIVGDKVFILNAGDALMAPRDISDQLRNSGNTENRYLLIFSPPGFEEFLQVTAFFARWSRLYRNRNNFISLIRE
jgi:AcrR family transcriptional regulator